MKIGRMLSSVMIARTTTQTTTIFSFWLSRRVMATVLLRVPLEVAVVREDEPEEREPAERDEEDPMGQDGSRIFLRDKGDLAPEEEHEADLRPHERGVLVTDPGPAVRLHHRPVQERVRRLIEVEERGDESAREKCTGDLSRARTAT